MTQFDWSELSECSMKFQIVLCCVVIVLARAITEAKNVKGNSPPNIVLFLVDDVSYSNYCIFYVHAFGRWDMVTSLTMEILQHTLQIFTEWPKMDSGLLVCTAPVQSAVHQGK